MPALIEHSELRFDPSGTLTLSMGTHDHGQGHQDEFSADRGGQTRN